MTRVISVLNQLVAKRRIFNILLAVFLVGALFCVNNYFGNVFSRDGLNALLALIQEYGKQTGVVGVIVFMSISVGLIVGNIPTVIVIVVYSMLYGPVLAICLTLVIWPVSCFIIFILSKTIMTGSARKKLNRLDKYSTTFGKFGTFHSIVWMRLVLFALPPANWGLSVITDSARNYVVGSFIGGIPHIIVWSVLGPRAIDSILDGSPGWWYSPEICSIVGFNILLTSIIPMQRLINTRYRRNVC